jgi:hypothetical protein
MAVWSRRKTWTGHWSQLVFYYYYYFYFVWGGVRLNRLVTPVTNWLIVPAPDVIWWMWSSRWNESWQGSSKCSEKTCSSATLSTTNRIWPDPDSNPGRRGGESATNCLSYGMAGIGHTSYVSVCVREIDSYAVLVGTSGGWEHFRDQGETWRW